MLAIEQDSDQENTSIADREHNLETLPILSYLALDSSLQLQKGTVVLLPCCLMLNCMLACTLLLNCMGVTTEQVARESGPRQDGEEDSMRRKS
jgi:hypothetical protein